MNLLRLAEQPPKPRNIGNAGLWAGSGRLLGRTFDIVALIILARVLTPADFGLVAMAMTVIRVVEALTEVPLHQPILRMAAPERRHYDTAFTLGAARAACIGLIMLAVAPLVARYYGESRLVLLVCFLALSPMLRGLASPKMADWVRRYDMRPEFVMVVGGKVAALAMIATVASTTENYWAIAVGTVTTPLVMCGISYLLAPYRPQLSLAGWPDFADVVGWNSLNQVFAALNYQLDRIVLGRWASPSELGRYTLAADVAALPIQAFAQPLNQPMLAAFAKARDLDSVDNLWLLGLNGLLAVLGPVFLTFATLATPLVQVALGPQWLPSTVYLVPLALAGCLAAANGMLPPLATALYRPDLNAKRTMASFTLRFPATVLGVMVAGPLGAVAATAVGAAAELSFSLHAAKRLAGVGINAQLWATRRTVAGLAAFAGTALLLSPEAEETSSQIATRLMLGGRILLAIGVGAAAMCTTIYLLWRAEGRPTGIESHLGRLASSNRLVRRFAGKQQ